MTLTMVILSLMILVATAACDYKTAMSAPSDYVYPYYALRFVSLGDYKKQSNQGAYNTADQPGYLRYITYMTDGSNIYRTIIRMKPGPNPAPTWARLPALSPSSHPNRDSAPASSTLPPQDATDFTNYGSALTWAKLQVQDASKHLDQNPTTDLSKIPDQDKWNQANPGQLETSTAIPAQERSIDEMEIITSSVEERENSDQDSLEQPTRDTISQVNHESSETSEKSREKSTTDQTNQEPQPQMQQQLPNSNEIPPSEDEILPTTTIKNTESREEKEEVSTLLPFPDNLNIDNDENAEESRETKLVTVPQEKEEINGNDLTAEETFYPKYISTSYSPLTMYPLGYQPYATQRRQMMRPMSGSIKNQNPLAYPTSTTSPERNPTKTLTTVPTMKPAIVGSSLPSLRYPTVSPMQISYAYPYMRYNGQSTMMYQVPQQHFKTNQQFLGWPGMSQSPYQPTYPHGYMSYQPSVLAVRSLPFAQTGINVKQ